MKTYTLLFAFLFCQACTDTKESSQRQAVEAEKVAPSVSRSKRAVDPMPPPPPPPPVKQTKAEVETAAAKSKVKVEKEENSFRNDMKRMLLEFKKAKKNGARVGKTTYNGLANLKKQYDLSCTDDIFNERATFDGAFAMNYKNSWWKTEKMDGEQFCLHQFEMNSDVDAKIIYGRNEGGHSTDDIRVYTINSSLLEIQTLDLFVETGWDGHSTKFESEFIDSVTIKRKTVATLGWREAGDKDGSKQPRSESVQIFKIRKDGSIEMLSEEIINYNFERYLGDD